MSVSVILHSEFKENNKITETVYKGDKYIFFTAVKMSTFRPRIIETKVTTCVKIKLFSGLDFSKRNCRLSQKSSFFLRM